MRRRVSEYLFQQGFETLLSTERCQAGGVRNTASKTHLSFGAPHLLAHTRHTTTDDGTKKNVLCSDEKQRVESADMYEAVIIFHNSPHPVGGKFESGKRKKGKQSVPTLSLRRTTR